MSAFRNALVFFDQLGVYDVVLPFLLIFTMVFAMLEKTKIFGVDEKDGKKVTRKNLNAMIAFCVAFLVVASSQLVALINITIAKTMVLLVAGILFMILAGSFSKDEELFLKGGWQKAFMWIMFLGIALILLYNLGWMQYAWNYASTNLNGPIVGSLALLIIVVGFMAWVTSSGDQGKKTENSGG
jgi:drug/metabolite transporter (DMT)-like permease